MPILFTFVGTAFVSAFVTFFVFGECLSEEGLLSEGINFDSLC